VSHRALRRAASLASSVLACGCLLSCAAGTAPPAVTNPTGSSDAARGIDTAQNVTTAADIAPRLAPAAPRRARVVASEPLSGRVVTVDPGHNGGNFAAPQQIGRLVNDGNGEKECDTTGTAAPDGYRETDFNWSVAVRLRALLRAAGARVVMTRSSNTGVGPCITERAAIGNRAHADAAISIHADGGPTNGSGFAILTPASIPGGADHTIIAPSHRLGIDLRGALERIGLHTSTYDGVDGIAPRTDLGGLNLSRVPKVFVEVANMQDATDERPMERPAFRERVAQGMLHGLEAFLARD
jgi:N-acetylmuramoyl-L-alanine amidase